MATSKDLVVKLKEMYKKEEKLIILLKDLKLKLQDLQDDKEMLKTSIKFLAIKEAQNEFRRR